MGSPPSSGLQVISDFTYTTFLVFLSNGFLLLFLFFVLNLYKSLSTDRRQERETGCVVADGGPALWPDGHGSVKGCLAQAWRRSWFSDKWTDDFSSAFWWRNETNAELKRRQSSKILILVNGGSAICLWILWQLKL
ncbi:hypothetical protein OIU85_021900 [Salix viminalis]|uniref:Uncharacterized protein n=1 Tax=Salix viminalis TaxID=40686 RepID=A0A9Q0ZE31_SALVM|nr:hypothetical protein OIU85_021900 [Salix viminalis]